MRCTKRFNWTSGVGVVFFIRLLLFLAIQFRLHPNYSDSATLKTTSQKMTSLVETIATCNHILTAVLPSVFSTFSLVADFAQCYGSVSMCFEHIFLYAESVSFVFIIGALAFESLFAIFSPIS